MIHSWYVILISHRRSRRKPSVCICFCCGSGTFLSDRYCNRVLSPLSSTFTRYQPFKHCEVTTASFLTNFSGVLLFPSKRTLIRAPHHSTLSVKQHVPDLYRDQDPLAHRKWVLHSLDCCRSFSFQNKLDLVSAATPGTLRHIRVLGHVFPAFSKSNVVKESPVIFHLHHCGYCSQSEIRKQ